MNAWIVVEGDVHDGQAVHRRERPVSVLIHPPAADRQAVTDDLGRALEAVGRFCRPNVYRYEVSGSDCGFHHRSPRYGSSLKDSFFQLLAHLSVLPRSDNAFYYPMRLGNHGNVDPIDVYPLLPRPVSAFDLLRFVDFSVA